MIRFIAAVDSKLGIANENGRPWQGNLKTDARYYRGKIKTADVLMGYSLYIELSKPYPDVKNYVATSKNTQLRPGFDITHNARDFLQKTIVDIWVLGGAGLYANTIDLADELYLTRIDKDFDLSKFFPDFDNYFVMISSSARYTENNIPFHFEVWRKKSKNKHT